jgi:hypothetical protein
LPSAKTKTKPTLTNKSRFSTGETGFFIAAACISKKLRTVNDDTIISLVIFGLVVVVIFAIAIIQGNKATANLKQLGEKLGLRLEVQGRFSKKHRLVGVLRDKSVEFYSYTTGSGKSQQKWAAVAVSVKVASLLTFSLKRRLSLFEFIARRFRKNAVEMGDADFDKAWVLITNRPDYMRAALLPEMREKILRLSGGGMRSANYKHEFHTVQYSEQGSFSSAKLCDRFEEIAGLLCDLADVVEVYDEVKK